MWFSFVCAILILGAMVFDYLYNDRFHRVEFHTVSLSDLQEKSEFTAPLMREGNLTLMTGAVRMAENITEGATAVVTVNGRRYDGYLYRLEPAFDGISIATVSVISPPEESGEATATLYGNYHRNLMLIPPECVIADEQGKDAVFVELNGYAVLRNVETGRKSSEEGIEILSGIFRDERLILSPKNIRMGDRISE